eukprot:6606784-Lingulodinium_polyedra.AAC.1
MQVQAQRESKCVSGSARVGRPTPRGAAILQQCREAPQATECKQRAVSATVPPASPNLVPMRPGACWRCGAPINVP